MSRKPVRHGDDVRVQVSVRVPGWLKNRVADAAEAEGVSINRFVAGVLLRTVEDREGFPVAPPARVALPSPGDVLRGSLSGESVLEPCGQPSPCGRREVVVLEGMGFCDVCRVRVL